MSLVSVLGSAVLPVVAVAVVGYALGRTRDVAVEPLSDITLYVLAPALVFYSLVTSPIAGPTVARLFGGVIAFVVGMVALAELVGRGLGEEEPTLGALVLSSTFSNAGNYGIPLSAFAFGALGRSTAVLFLVAQNVLMYTVGVYVAARGEAGSTRGALVRVFRLPLIYAVAAAAIVRATDAAPPTDTALMETIRLTGDAAIPVMLLMLGIQLANSGGGTPVARTMPASTLKLIVAPVFAAVIALGLGLTGTVGKVFVLECAMPAAVTPLMLTIEFGSDGFEEGLSAADYVSTTILVTTLASLVTLTVLITILQSGLVL
ncbi:AEC family transporter [Halorientalis halophila]|uniref:AEC family transporter n=1 Tax=Halorientalis halophila TaxID=3108499 RepID=UPI003008FEFC